VTSQFNLSIATGMVLAIILSALAMTLIVGLRYLLTSGAFAWATKARHPGLYTGLEPQMRREIGWSLVSAVIYGVPAGIVAWGWDNRGWTQIYTDVSAYPLWYLPLSIFLYLFAHDTWFYWTHRLMHRPWWFRIAHKVHHESKPPTAWAAMSFHPWEALTGAVVIPALVFLIPIHVAALGLVLTIMTIMGITNHMGWEIFPRWLVEGRAGQWVITASHHQKHHSDYRCNYGLYFRFWDRLCGTDRDIARDFPGWRRAS
jgi:Delta7-sterol 5-desaturase